MRNNQSRADHITRDQALRRSRRANTTMLVTSLLSALVGIGLLSLDTAQAMGLDEIAQQSGLGEPLRLVIPVLTNAADEVGGEDLAGECFKLVPGAGDKLDDVPQVLAARVALEHRGNRAFLVLTTTRAMNEPVIRVAVQAGCRVSLRREYTVLLDPITIDTPASAAAVATAEPRNPSVTTSAVEQAAAIPAMASPEARPTPAPRQGAPRKRVAAAPRTVKPAAEGQRPNATASVPAPVAPRSSQSAQQPRLQVSRSAVDATAAQAAPGRPVPPAPSERELTRAVEVETAVLQRRVAELSLMVERMQQDLRDAQAARTAAEQAARVASEKAAAATSPWVVLSIWAEENWPLLVAVLALIVLIAAMLFSKRRREAAAAAVPITGMAADSFEPTYLGEPSLIATPIVGASEANAKSQEANTSRPSVTPAAATQPAPVPEFHLDPEFAFDDELVKGAERFSAYSTLEREHPGIVAKLTDTWGKPEAVANLQDYLMTPRQGGRPLSRDAMSELKMLQAVASDKSSEESGTIPWQPGRPKPRRV